MQEVQLYISGERVDLFKDESISLTSSIQNVRDISKVFSDFSQTFSLPASKTNNKIFEHWYNYSIEGGFDARYRVDANIELNFLPFRKGKIRLESVKLKQGKPFSYNVTFFGETVTLKDLLGDDLLSDIDFSDYSQEYSLSKTTSLLQSGATVNGISNAVIVPLISAEQRWFYDSSTQNQNGNLHPATGNGANYTNLKFAIKIYAILKEIENKYGIEFSTDFFSATQSELENLYLWLNRSEGQTDLTGSYEYTLNRFQTDYSSQGIVSTGYQFLISDIPTNSQYYEFALSIDVSDTAAEFDIVVLKDSVEWDVQTGFTGSSGYLINFPNINQNGEYRINIRYTNSLTVLTGTYASFTRHTLIGGIEFFNYSQTQDILLPSDFTTSLSDVFPEIKVIDFLTGLFKMFNLTAYFNDNGIIEVKTLDSYYQTGGEIDLTQYIESSETTVKPSKIYKTIEFKYKGLATYLAKNHNEIFNSEWGTEKYAIDNKFDGSKYVIEVPFGHMKYERLINPSTEANTSIQWGWSVKDVSESGDPNAIVPKALLFYAINNSGESIMIKSDTTSINISNYFIPSNSKSLTDSQTLHFKEELNEYTGSSFSQTLFQNFYSNYIVDVFREKSRLFSFSAYLPLKVLLELKLNDVIIISGEKFRVNSMTTDLQTGKTQFELKNLL